MIEETDSIVALSSGRLPAGIAVLRLSGPAARPALDALAAGVPEPRRAALRALRSPDGTMLDRALVLFFPGPRSVTGEDLAEFHLHGGRAVVASTLEALCTLPGVRLAVAGEFTRRAFENGRLDLTEAEGLADLLSAETDAQRRRALAQAGGALHALYARWHRHLTHARAMLEAAFDFSDEGDVPATVSDSACDAGRALAVEIEAHLAGARRGEILREGYRVAIVGAPNAGKSSLLNWLARRDLAIVSDIPGTTRDVLEVTLDLKGIPVRFADTAGLRETSDPIETIGIERAHRSMEEADLVLHLVAPGDTPTHVRQDGKVLTIGTKRDLDAEERRVDISISVMSGEGLDALVDAIAVRAGEAVGDPDALVPTRSRHREILRATLEALQPLDPHLPPEILSEILRLAAFRLGALTGQAGVEDLLDVIFSEFCIGK